ncbi:hypothetical protein METBIDRAFT_9238 [Metschnikowia bicuspidata var. bicuspidata NRRL YB-4993]|uniref:Uncharacterized protein n=1 Tax=Metschnikowia bicuspidata var. bicuspidata NRRL YB-4993 TaxID=869754 RepID=A0A1A0HFG4_9ASCO|nr:hypothetical protein METBIDRAFT_9238 [Metschnikowia bicuspidata var. bicuspidata NRRL YB-4993]OBA22889.1 hypothetical protein METBIDRAFT_9238 [Metschnikowia bicuspidata var. bicuspidata NRRL YB-4993]
MPLSTGVRSFFAHSDAKGNSTGVEDENHASSLKDMTGSDVNEAGNNFFLKRASNFFDLISHEFEPLPSEVNQVSPEASNKNTKKYGDLSSSDELFAGGTPQPNTHHSQYIRPLIELGSVISNDYLPDSLHRQSRNPIIAYEESGKEKKKVNNDEYEDLSDDELDKEAVPTGEWTSPVVREALARQVSKELQFKTLWTNILRLFSAHFFFVVTQKVVQIYWASHGLEASPDNAFLIKFFQPHHVEYAVTLVGKAHEYARHLLWLFVVIIIFDIAMVLWPQDQCKDLPLTVKQRELIGLKSIPSGETGDVSDTASLEISQRLFESASTKPLHIPKYSRINELPNLIKRKEKDNFMEELASDLKHVKHQNRLNHASRIIEKL